jgi:hypothetical protein
MSSFRIPPNNRRRLASFRERKESMGLCIIFLLSYAHPISPCLASLHLYKPFFPFLLTFLHYTHFPNTFFFPLKNASVRPHMSCASTSFLNPYFVPPRQIFPNTRFPDTEKLWDMCVCLRCFCKTRYEEHMVCVWSMGK